MRVIAHAGVIAPLCVDFLSWESINSFLFGDRTKNKAPPALPPCGADLMLYLMQRSDGSRQLSTYLPTYLPFAVSPLFADNTTTKLEPYRHHSLHYTYFVYRRGDTTYHGPCPPAQPMYLPSPARMIHSSSPTTSTLHPASTSQHGRVFDLLGIAHVGVTAQGCAFTSQHGRVCDLFRVPHVGVTAQGCASEMEIKSFNSFSAQGPESSHPCAIKIKVRNHSKTDRTGVMTRTITVFVHDRFSGTDPMRSSQANKVEKTNLSHQVPTIPSDATYYHPVGI